MYVKLRRRDLLVIPPGPDGLSMKYLASFVGQGKTYVRPRGIPEFSIRK